jgi:hypothetical protein
MTLGDVDICLRLNYRQQFELDISFYDLGEGLTHHLRLPEEDAKLFAERIAYYIRAMED